MYALSPRVREQSPGCDRLGTRLLVIRCNQPLLGSVPLAGLVLELAMSLSTTNLAVDTLAKWWWNRAPLAISPHETQRRSIRPLDGFFAHRLLAEAKTSVPCLVI